MIYSLIFFALGFLVSLLTTPLVIRLAQRGIGIDQPGEARKIHDVPTPRLGGAPIMLSLSIGLIGILTSDSTFYRAVAQFNTWVQRLPTGVSVNIYVAQFAPTSFTHLQFPELWPKDNLHPTTHTPLAFPTPVVNVSF